MADSLSVAGLFAGIGGIELGLESVGHRSVVLSEIEPAARTVLAARMPERTILGDIRTIEELPSVDVVAGGFPCQDLSQAGRTAGITGKNSGLVDEVFRLVTRMAPAPRWLVLENVPFMLQLGRGNAMRYVTSRLEELGFHWAYRVVDTRAFGLPQRRQRVIIVASQAEDPRSVLFGEDHAEPDWPNTSDVACGFYWTEGVRGLGWAVDAIPTLKGGSTIGIPSSPAIRMPDGRIVTPAIEDAERLQGFPAGWTEAALTTSARGVGSRWKLVGNAVSVPVFAWLGSQLTSQRSIEGITESSFGGAGSWPRAARSGKRGSVKTVEVGPWPAQHEYIGLADFLEFEPKPLSAKASQGFLNRARRSSLRFPDGLLDDVESHLAQTVGATLFAA